MSSGLSVRQSQAVADSAKRVVVWDGAVRSGKTFAWIFLLLWKVAAHKGVGGIVIVGKNRDSVYRNVFEPIEQNDEFAPFRRFVHYRQGAAFSTIFGKKVHVIGANDAGAESRIRGMTLALSFVDELTVVHVAFFKQLLARLSVSGAQLFATTNPDTPGHWLMKDYLAKIPGSRHYNPKTPEGDRLPGWTYWHFTMEDNPSLDEEYKSSLKREYTGVWYRRFILGEWVAADGAIYDFFDTNVHTIDPDNIPQIQRVLSLGIDYGTTHPTRGYLLGLGADNRLYILDEWAPNRGTDATLSRDLWRKRKEWAAKGWVPEWTYVDPAAASFSLQLFEDGHPDVTKADNAVLDGIRTMASLLDNGQMLISSTCTELIQELPGYIWDDKAGEKGVEQPVKDNDDCADAARYTVYSSRWQWADVLDRGMEKVAA